ncbi:MAG: (2Fe-2S)-binding protein [Alphaproteobacteria bacterium]|nr:(2Fe-2S)-binding protein [Alphaproteobacteria bacterium]
MSEQLKDTRDITVTVNGKSYQEAVETRLHLADFLRLQLKLTGTHLGCEHGVCGACTILVDGEAVRSCLMLAVQANGREVTTIEGLADGEELSPIQEAFSEHHALQCGFCTSGMIMSLTAFIEENPGADEAAIREAISGNICRCTGYQSIVAAGVAVAAKQAGGS